MAVEEEPLGAAAEMDRRIEGLVDEREIVPFREKNRRVEEARRGGTKSTAGEQIGGEFGPRSACSRCSAV